MRLPQAAAQDWVRQPVQAAALMVDGQPQHSWRAFLEQLPNRHWAAVVRGPPAAAVDAHGVSGGQADHRCGLTCTARAARTHQCCLPCVSMLQVTWIPHRQAELACLYASAD